MNHQGHMNTPPSAPSRPKKVQPLIEEPLQSDIKCGKDKTYNRWHGNKVFRELIFSYQDLYSRAEDKHSKMRITKEIVNILESRYHARFIKYNGDKWEEISHQAARDKVSHALRFAFRTSTSSPMKSPARRTVSCLVPYHQASSAPAPGALPRITSWPSMNAPSAAWLQSQDTSSLAATALEAASTFCTAQALLMSKLQGQRGTRAEDSTPSLTSSSIYSRSSRLDNWDDSMANLSSNSDPTTSAMRRQVLDDSMFSMASLHGSTLRSDFSQCALGSALDMRAGDLEPNPIPMLNASAREKESFRHRMELNQESCNALPTDFTDTSAVMKPVQETSDGSLDALMKAPLILGDHDFASDGHAEGRV